VFRQVAGGLNERGSLRTSNLDFLEADFVVSLIEQLQIAVRAGRQQAHAALKQTVGLNPEEPLELARVSLPEGPRVPTWLSVAAAIVEGFSSRPENREVDLFTKIREQQVVFAKAAWAPNIVFAGNVIDITGNTNSILNAVDGIAATFLVDVPIYDSSRRARLREALGLEQASLAFQRQVEQLLTLEIEVTALEAQRAAATALRSARASQVAAEHYDASRQAYSRELIPASGVVIALGLDAVAKLGHLQAVYSYEYAQAKLKRVTADRETRYGY
jgi:outer membrane protein TolC